MHLLGMFDKVPMPPMEGAVVGSYSSVINGVECVLKLWFNAEGYVHGAFTAEGETLEIRGGFAQDRMYGFVLERYQHVPVAIFDARVIGDGIELRLGAPEFEDLLAACEAERVLFSRIPAEQRAVSYAD